MGAVILVNVIFWGIFLFFYSNRKVSIEEAERANTPTKLMNLQKKIQARGLEKFQYGKQFIEINVRAECSWCDGRGVIYGNSKSDDAPPYYGCPKCGGRNYRKGSGKQNDLARINQEGEIFKKVNDTYEKINFLK